MADGPYVLAVDLGTSGPKAAVVSLHGRIAATARAQVETLLLPDDGVEQDPEAVWDAVKSVCGQAFKRSGVAAKDLLAVICSSQYSSIVPVDNEGRATMNLVMWLDKRGVTRRLKKIDGYPRRTDNPLRLLQWIRVHGLAPLDGSLSLAHLRWIKYACPEVYARTATFLEPMDYITMRFSGRATANQCTALMSLVTDNRSLNVTDYDPTLVRYSHIDREKLPELVPLDSIVGTVLPGLAAELGLSPETKVVTGLNDTQSGGMGTYAFGGSHAAISVGSTSVMITHVKAKKTDALHMIFSMPSPVPDTYFVMAENGVGGGTLEHFLGNFVYAQDHFGQLPADGRFALLQRAVDETPPGSKGLLFLPWVGGSLAPIVDADMRGGFLNIGLHTTRSLMARAILEGVALNLRWLKKPVERFAKRTFSHFIYYGGGAESDAWCQIMADVLEAPVHQMENPQYTTCVGAGLLAFQRLGLIGFNEFERSVPIRRVYEPNRANKAVYDEMSTQFVRAFKRNRPIFRSLNRRKP